MDSYMETWTSHLPDILHAIQSSEVMTDPKARIGTDAYLVPSPDRQDLHFALPVIIKGFGSDGDGFSCHGSSGAVLAVIEHSKKESASNKRLGILYGVSTGNQSRYAHNREPCTIASSESRCFRLSSLVLMIMHQEMVVRSW